MAKKKEERKEDLNPRSDDVDEKIRQLLDPLVPDKEEPEEKEDTKDTKSTEIKEVSGKRAIAVSDDSEDQTAPELPSKKKKKIVPIVHDEDVPEADAEEPEDKPIRKIEIDDADESTEDVAEKLDEAIAELSERREEKPEADDSEEPDDSEQKQEESEKDKTAPALETEDEKPEADDNSEEEPGKEKSEESESADDTNDDSLSKKETKNKDESDEDLEESELITDDKTEDAVRDIVANEGDALLEKDDAKLAKKQKEADKKTAKQPFLKRFFGAKATKVLFGLTLVGLLIAGLVIPSSRYAVLNAAGVRSGSSMTVIDQSSQQPLKNVSVTMGGETLKTDSEGYVEFSNLRLGQTTLTIERTAFAPVEKTLVLGWGSNPLGSFMLQPTGAQYKFQVNDFLSGNGVSDAEIDTEYASAGADEKGLVILTLPALQQQTVDVTLSADGYRQETLTLNLSEKDITTVNMAPHKKHAFISRRSGNYDIYTVYADGKDEQLLLKATGTEREDLSLIVSPFSASAAYASTRSGKQNSDGFLLTDLVILNTEDGSSEYVTTSEKIQLIGWWDEFLVYVTTSSGESAAKADRSKLITYNSFTQTEVVIAQANYFNDIAMIENNIYYAPSGVYSQEKGRFYVAQADQGETSATLFDGEVWSILRTGYKDLTLSAGQDWYTVSLGQTAAQELATSPSNVTDRQYTVSPSKSDATWVDQRDGKGVLINYVLKDSKEEDVLTLSGIKQSLTWLNSKSIVFRIENRDETADYIVNIDGGDAKKIVDVTSTSNQNSWYFY